MKNLISALLLLAYLLTMATPVAAQSEPRILYPLFVGVQVTDLHSTHGALRAGAFEMNPLMVNPWVRYPLKTLLTASMLASAEKLRKEGKGKRAFWTLFAVTLGTGAISYWNYRVAHNLEGGR